MSQLSFTACAPATIANVCCGFDVLGFAIDSPVDTVTATLTTSHNDIIITTIHGAENLSKALDKNIIGLVATAFMQQLGKKQGIELELHKGMSIGTGLGSSAASAVAATVALNAVFDKPFTPLELLSIALEGERQISGGLHADNVAPALLGGFVLVKGYHPLEVYDIPCSLDLHCAILYPHIKILTGESRAALAKMVAMPQVVEQTANIAGLVLALTTSNIELLKSSLQDAIIESQRCQQIPNYNELKAAALNSGALGCGISGSGPSVFALCDSASTARNVGAAMQKACSSVESNVILSSLNALGARIVS